MVFGSRCLLLFIYLVFRIHNNLAKIRIQPFQMNAYSDPTFHFTLLQFRAVVPFFISKLHYLINYGFPWDHELMVFPVFSFYLELCLVSGLQCNFDCICMVYSVILKKYVFPHAAGYLAGIQYNLLVGKTILMILQRQCHKMLRQFRPF
jgi:hypothetical protein